MRKLAYVFVAAALAASGAGPAWALESSKAAVALGNLTALGTASATISGDTLDDTGWVTVARTFIKTPNKKELAFDMALQCGLVTDTKVKSKGGNKETSEARGSIRVRVKVTDEAGTERFAAPAADTFTPIPSDPNGIDISGPVGVTYCDRFQKLEATFAGLNCFVVPGDPPTVSCPDPEELRLILKTLNANAFNFLLADVVPGVQKIEVQARAQATVALGGVGDELGDATAEAFVGLGSLLVETIRLIKDEDGTPVLQ